MKYTKEVLSKNIGKIIKIERKRLKLTQEELAFKIKVEPKTLSKVETGARFISANLLVKLCKEFDKKPHEFFLFGEVAECKEKNEKLEAINEMLNGVESEALDLVYRMVKGIKQ